MINWQELTINMFVEELRLVYDRTYGDIDQTLGRIVTWCGRLALENIAKLDLDIRIILCTSNLAAWIPKHNIFSGFAPRAPAVPRHIQMKCQSSR